MKRFIESGLLEWKRDKKRKPLILSGARQVGKSYVIEKNFSSEFDSLISINFEKQPEFKNCFDAGFTPKAIVRRIEALSGKRVEAGKTLLFFDEVQACREAITSLRYFYEEMPSLHLIAAGSLLEFTIENMSIPVGRVTYRYLTPLSFNEFLFNSGNEILLNEIKNHSISAPFPEAFHNKAIALLKDYMAIGGMPQVVSSYIEKKDYLKCEELLFDLLESYTRDFPKYASNDSDLKYIGLVFSRAPQCVGKQFKYVHISRDIQAKYLRKGLDLLAKADVIQLIYKTSFLPLGAQYNPNKFKLLFLDTGLMQRACGLNISQWITDSYQLINAGAIAEQFVGQEIMASGNFRKGRLYYWESSKRGSMAEVDYMVDRNREIKPIEVKSGATGKLRSMHALLGRFPQITEGIKVSLDNFNKTNAIQSIPLYAFGSWLTQR